MGQPLKRPFFDDFPYCISGQKIQLGEAAKKEMFFSNYPSIHFKNCKGIL